MTSVSSLMFLAGKPPMRVTELTSVSDPMLPSADRSPAPQPPLQVPALDDPKHQQNAVFGEGVVHDPVVAHPDPMKRVVCTAN